MRASRGNLQYIPEMRSSRFCLCIQRTRMITAAKLRFSRLCEIAVWTCPVHSSALFQVIDGTTLHIYTMQFCFWKAQCYSSVLPINSLWQYAMHIVMIFSVACERDHLGGHHLISRGGRVSGMDQSIFFHCDSADIHFFLAAWSSNYLFYFFTYLFQLYLEGNYLFQRLAATSYLFYHLLALNYLFQKYPCAPHP